MYKENDKYYLSKKQNFQIFINQRIFMGISQYLKDYLQILLPVLIFIIDKEKNYCFES